jgi:hypothetical protein
LGLELGPPWLVIVIRDPGSGYAEVIYRDNFTGASLRRAVGVRKNESGSFAAVIDHSGNFARHSDGRIFDPIEETKGRYSGTHAERGHYALLLSQKLLRKDFDPSSPLVKRKNWWFFLLCILGFYVFAILEGALF